MSPGWSGSLEYADRGREPSGDVRAVLARLKSGLGSCGRCRSARATRLIGGADGPVRCARCAETEQADKRRGRKLAGLQNIVADADRLRRLRFAQAVAESSASADRYRLVGFVARYDDSYRRADGFSETVTRGAFADSIRRGNLALCVDHDPSRVLAQQRDGTLIVRETDLGLWIEADCQSSEGRALVAGRGDRPFGGSFAFHESNSRVELTQPPRRARILRKLDVAELSIITTGRAAYRRSWLVRDSPRARARAADERLEEARDAFA